MSDKKTKLAQIATAYALGTKLYDTGRSLWVAYDEKRTYHASVSERSSVYSNLLCWLEDKANPKNIRLTVVSGNVKREYNESSIVPVVLEGYKIEVSLIKPEVKAAYIDDETSSSYMNHIRFSTKDKRGIEAVERLIAKIAEESAKQERSFHLWTIGNHGWAAKSFGKRDLDSVFLPSGVKEDLIADIEGFFDSEEHYRKIGVPWHRGYVFYGPPGNGKSSTVSAIARKYRLNVYSMPLSTVDDDKKLGELINSIQPNSILLIEDIDIFSAATSRTDNHKGPTLNGLLNALDGVATPHGLMTFITTNHIESLDPALIRPGRVDKRVELVEPTTYQIDSMFEYVYNEPLRTIPKKFKSMAELANIFKIHVNDPEGARLEIKG